MNPSMKRRIFDAELVLIEAIDQLKREAAERLDAEWLGHSMSTQKPTSKSHSVYYV